MFSNAAGVAATVSARNALAGPRDYEMWTEPLGGGEALRRLDRTTRQWRRRDGSRTSASASTHERRTSQWIATSAATRDSFTPGGTSAASFATPRETVAFSENEPLSPGMDPSIEAEQEDEENSDAAWSYAVDEDESPEMTGIAAAVTDITEEDPDPSFDDTTPRQLLEELIKAYETFVRDGKNTIGLEDFQRKLIEHATEWNNAYQPPYELRDLWLELARMLLAGTNNPNRLAEAHTILHTWHPAQQSQGSLTPCAQAVPVTALRTPIDENKTIKQSAFYCTMAELGLQQYDDTKNDRYLIVAAKWAKRCFKLRLELRGTHKTEFEESVHLLIAIFKLQQLSVAVNVLIDIYLQPDTPPLCPVPSSAPIVTSPGSASPSQVRSPSSPRNQAGWHDINELDDHGFTKLIRAVRRGDTAVVGRCCDEWNADFEAPDSKGRTALLHAVEKEDPAMVTKLLDSGADIESTFEDLTVLHHAIRLHQPEIVKILLGRGAEMKITIPASEQVSGGPHDCGLAGRTTLMYAVLNTDVSDLPPNTTSSAPLEIISTLCEKLEQHEKDVCDSERFSALHHALSPRKGAAVSYTLVKTLVDLGVSPGIQGPEGETPLFGAIKRKERRVIELLLGPEDLSKEKVMSKQELNKQNNADRTALYVAAKYNDFETVKLLLARDAGFDEHGSLDQDLTEPGISLDVAKLIQRALSLQGKRTSSQCSRTSSQRSRTPSTPSVNTSASSESKFRRLTKISSSLSRFRSSGQ